jgi:hypothetical protein
MRTACALMSIECFASRRLVGYARGTLTSDGLMEWCLQQRVAACRRYMLCDHQPKPSLTHSQHPSMRVTHWQLRGHVTNPR